jgi:hypothetical protein
MSTVHSVWQYGSTFSVYVMLSCPLSQVAIESLMVLLHWSLRLGSNLAIK